MWLVSVPVETPNVCRRKSETFSFGCSLLSTSRWFLPGWVYFLLQSSRGYITLTVLNLFPAVIKLYEVYFIADSSACSAFVCLGHWLRPGLNSCYKLLLVTGIWLHPGLNACSRQWYVLRCTACKFLLRYSLFSANTDSSSAPLRPPRTKRPDVSDPPSGRHFIFKYHKLDDVEPRGAWHTALS